ncbi:MAG TPA: HEPN domain-containing protein [bacterium]|nr:HEPN domain-containing protein [bacterium]
MKKEYNIISKEYLLLAKQDIFVSKILLKEKVYNLAIFHLSQAVEKITKSYCLTKTLDGVNPLFNFKELKKFHNPLDLLLDLIKKYMQYYNYKSSPLYEEIKFKLKKQKETIKKINGRESYKRIKKQIDFLENLENLDIEKIAKENYNINPLSKEQLDQIKLNLRSFKEFLPLSLLGAITFRHYLSTRYPYETVDKKGEIISNIKFREYKKGLGVVDALEELIKLTETTLQNFLETFKEKVKI